MHSLFCWPGQKFLSFCHNARLWPTDRRYLLTYLQTDIFLIGIDAARKNVLIADASVACDCISQQAVLMLVFTRSWKISHTSSAFSPRFVENGDITLILQILVNSVMNPWLNECYQTRFIYCTVHMHGDPLKRATHFWRTWTHVHVHYMSTCLRLSSVTFVHPTRIRGIA